MFIVSKDEKTVVNVNNIVGLEMRPVNPLTKDQDWCIVAVSDNCTIVLERFGHHGKEECKSIFYKLLDRIKDKKDFIEIDYLGDTMW